MNHQLFRAWIALQQCVGCGRAWRRVPFLSIGSSNPNQWIIWKDVGEVGKLKWYLELSPPDVSPPDDSPLGAFNFRGFFLYYKGMHQHSWIFLSGTWRNTVINPHFTSANIIFINQSSIWGNTIFINTTITRILCMNPISISVKEASFLSTEHLYLKITPCMNPFLIQFRLHYF